MIDMDWHDPALIPELLYFQNNNEFTGSVNEPGAREFRYRLSPVVVKEEKSESITGIRAEWWYGPFCYHKSKPEASADFSIDEPGRQAAIDWVAEQYRHTDGKT